MTIFSTHWLKGAKSATAGSILRFFVFVVFKRGFRLSSCLLILGIWNFRKIHAVSALDFFQNAGSVRGASGRIKPRADQVYHDQWVRHSQKELNATFLEGSKFNLLCKCKVQTLQTTFCDWHVPAVSPTVRDTISNARKIGLGWGPRKVFLKCFW